MSIQELNLEEQRIVRECLVAAVEGPFFDSRDEFHSLFGLWPDEVKRIAENSQFEEDCERVNLAINNALNNLLNYPHGCTDAVWSNHISVPPEEVRRIYTKWKSE